MSAGGYVAVIVSSKFILFVNGKKPVSMITSLVSIGSVIVYSFTTPFVTVTVGFPGESLNVFVPSIKLSGSYSVGAGCVPAIVTVPEICSVVFQKEYPTEQNIATITATLVIFFIENTLVLLNLYFYLYCIDFFSLYNLNLLKSA